MAAIARRRLIRVGCCGWPVGWRRYAVVFNNIAMWDDARRFQHLLV